MSRKESEVKYNVRSGRIRNIVLHTFKRDANVVLSHNGWEVCQFTPKDRQRLMGNESYRKKAH